MAINFPSEIINAASKGQAGFGKPQNTGALSATLQSAPNALGGGPGHGRYLGDGGTKFEIASLVRIHDRAGSVGALCPQFAPIGSGKARAPNVDRIV